MIFGTWPWKATNAVVSAHVQRKVATVEHFVAMESGKRCSVCTFAAKSCDSRALRDHGRPTNAVVSAHLQRKVETVEHFVAMGSEKRCSVCEVAAERGDSRALRGHGNPKAL